MGIEVPEGSAAPEQPKKPDVSISKPSEEQQRKNKMRGLLAVALLAVLAVAGLLIALVFDGAGNHQECVGPALPVDNSCSSNSDCGAEYYCSSGECLDHGQCSNISDCHNPDNLFPLIQCPGFLTCENGQCGKNCTNTNCPDNQPPWNCIVSPCSVLNSNCDEIHDTCVDDYCGGCNAYAFNASGHQVCPDAVTACTNRKDCDPGHYCSRGECLQSGHCTKTVDCLNPSNVFSADACVGLLTCGIKSGMCEMECGSSFCPGGAAPVYCFIQPCSVVSCVEEYAFCLDDYCNGCGTILLDNAGNEVNCTPPQ